MKITNTEKIENKGKMRKWGGVKFVFHRKITFNDLINNQVETEFK